MYPESNNDLNRENSYEIYFFTPAYHPLDNFSAHTVTIWDKTFSTVEHAFQWKKFAVSNPTIAEEIFNAGSPYAVKKISDTNKKQRSPSWNNEKVSVMKEILNAKSIQHEDVREALKKTGSRKIIENSPVDDFWGIGPNGNGKNTIGLIWMEIRDGMRV